MKRACLLSLALVGCVADSTDVHYTGETRRFVVDSIALPMSNTQAREFGADLNRDRTVDNQLGMVISTLNSYGNITTHGRDMIAAGVIASSVELVADDFMNDDTVAIRYLGADGEDAELVGGAFSDGTFKPATTGTALVHLPVFVDADPIVVHLEHMRVTLVADGRGGFDAYVAGAIAADEAKSAAFVGVDQMLTSRPGDHRFMFGLLDTNPHDFVVTKSEFETSSLIVSLLGSDVTLGGKQMLSIGFRVHLSACADGRCNTAPPATTCFDRVHNGDEANLDCGGSCAPCMAGATCSSDADCESGSCDGTCAAPTCFDGMHDGFETDVDCGGPCGRCATGQGCWNGNDCASLMCGAPCTGLFCDDLSFDVCR